MYGTKAVNVGQIAVLSKLKEYLSFNKRDEGLIKKFNDGYCAGLASLWLYTKWLQTHPGKDQVPPDNYEWFKTTIELILEWQKPTGKMLEYWNYLQGLSYWDAKKWLAELDTASPKEATDLHKIIDSYHHIERFVSHIELFQNVFTYLPYVQVSQEKIIKDTRSRILKKEYSIAALLTLNQLEQLLAMEDFIQEDRLIYISTVNHATALYRHQGKYYYFDANSATGEIELTSTAEVAKLIFDNNFSEFDAMSRKRVGPPDYNQPYPLGFNIFSFDPEPLKPYPSQRQVLDKIKPVMAAINREWNNITGLMLAVKINSLESVQYYLERGAAVNEVDEGGMSLFSGASAYGYLDIIKYLWSRGADYNLANQRGQTPLILAAKSGHIDVIDFFLKNLKVDHNWQDSYGRTALMYAAQNGWLEVVSRLLECQQTELNEIDEQGKDALMLAAENGHVDIVRLLLEKKAVFIRTNYDHDSALDLAIINHRLPVINLFLENPVIVSRINQLDINDRTLLMLASSYGHGDIVKVLLGKGAKVNQINSKEIDALMVAAGSDQPEMVELLLKNGANPNRQDRRGCTALMYAAEHNYFKVVAMLLANGADPALMNEKKETALTIARRGTDNFCLMFGCKPDEDSLNESAKLLKSQVKPAEATAPQKITL